MKIWKTTILIILIIVLSVVDVVGVVAIHIFYPLNYKASINNFSDSYNIDRALVCSVINTESGFNKNANSKSGACGLMQIMPKTAQWIADCLKIEEFNLYNPKTNIEFGCFYLRYLFDKFNDLDTVLACFNAGEGNVSKWLVNDKVNLNLISFKETSSYIVKVKKNLKIYKNLYRL